MNNTSRYDLLVKALVFSVVAPTDEESEMASFLIEKLSQRVTLAELEKAVAEAKIIVRSDS